MIPISLSVLVDELQCVNNDCRAYLNRTTGEIVTLLTTYMDKYEDTEENEDSHQYHDWERDMMKEAQGVLSSSDFLPLPEPFEIDEHHMMQSFCYTIDDYYVRDTLMGCIHKKGAFRRFKNAIDQFRLRDNWFEFKRHAYKELAVDWLEEHDIPYQDDME
jgi:hypothetical protein